MRGSRIAFALGLLALVIVYAGSRSVVYPVGRPEKPVEIVRDSLGVPHVFAATRRDLFFAQGYASAADRMFQMDWSRRRLLGRQAEIVGSSRIVADFRIRALALEAVARDLYDRLDPGERLALDAYAAGVNEWLRTRSLPVEFRRLGYRPDPWRAIDGLVIWRGMALTLTDLTDDLEDSAVLGPAPAGRGPVDPEDRLGSNAWAVSGALSQSGHPLLAGDPHLGYAMPGALMRMALSDTGAAATGFALPGVPGIAIGRTRRVAFTATAFQGDAADVYRFPWIPGEKGRYRTPEGVAEVETNRPLVWLKIRGPLAVPVFWQAIETTRFGPVVGKDASHLAVLRWAGRESIPGEGLITVAVISADGLGDVERVLGRLGLPDLNVIAADDRGNIARYAAGMLPRRPGRRGPRDALEPAAAWRGFWTFDAMPRRVNPPEGYVLSANGAPPADFRLGALIEDPADPDWLGRDWPGEREARLEELLSAPSSFGGDDFAALQRDRLVPGGLEAARRLVAGAEGAALSPRAARALAILGEWDGVAEVDAVGPTLFRTWEAFGPGTAGLENAVRFLARLYGDAVDGWTWGRVHQVVLRHPLDAIDSTWTIGPFPHPGDRGTVDVAGYDRFDLTRTPPALSLHGPAMRMIADLAPGGETRAVLLAGQSGDPESPHYRDQLDAWREGRTFVLTPPGERPGAALGVVRLEP